MGDNPPTYQEANLRDPLQLVAPYLELHDLASASRVCRGWHRAANARLWWDPLSSLPVAVNLLTPAIAFWRGCVLQARESTRALVRRVSTKAQIRPEELRKVLELVPLLPSLGGVSVQGQHTVTEGLASWTKPSPATARPLAQGYPIQALNLAHCPRSFATPARAAFRVMPHLCLLDLSFTLHTNRLLPDVADGGLFPSLQILKLRGTGLMDEDVQAMAIKLSTRVWYLDLRDNLLSDACADTLLDYCFCPPDYQAGDGDPAAAIAAAAESVPLRRAARPDLARAWPRWQEESARKEGYAPPLRPQDADPTVVHDHHHRPEQMECWLLRELERAPQLFGPERVRRGITHLYLSGNMLSASGFTRLLHSGRLRALDCGCVLLPGHDKVKPSNLTRTEFREIGGAASLLLPLQEPAVRRTLQWLRVCHHFVTGPSMLQAAKPEIWDLPPDPAQASALFRPTVALPPFALYQAFPVMNTLVLCDLPQHDPAGGLSRALKTFLYFCSMHEACVAEVEWLRTHPTPAPHMYPYPRASQRLRRLYLEIQDDDAPPVHMPLPPPPPPPPLPGEFDAAADLEDALSYFATDHDGQVFLDAVARDFSFFRPPNGEGGSIYAPPPPPPRLPPGPSRRRVWRNPPVCIDPNLQLILDAIEDCLMSDANPSTVLAVNLHRFLQDGTWPRGLWYELARQEVSGWQWSGQIKFRAAIAR